MRRIALTLWLACVLAGRGPASVTSPASLRLRGWNVVPAEVKASR